MKIVINLEIPGEREVWTQRTEDWTGSYEMENMVTHLTETSFYKEDMLLKVFNAIWAEMTFPNRGTLVQTKEPRDYAANL